MLIDREQVLDCLNRNAEQIRETLDDYLLFTAEEEKFSWGLGLVESMIADVEELPSAERKGKWIEDDDPTVKGHCSVCGWESHYYEDDVVGMPFCPNCGARMEGEEE